MKITKIYKLLLVGFMLASVCSCGAATDKSVDNNLGQKNPADDASGGFVWGRNDPKTGEHVEEESDLEVIKRQEEVLKRQEIEKERLEKEKQDILRQKYYNEKLKHQ